MASEIENELLRGQDSACEVPERPAWRLLQDSAHAHPERMALVARDRSLTYGQLNAEANAVGRALVEHGAAPETMVAVMADRDSWAYVMREGALKAGAAFMPIDPEYPEERVRYILEDSGARMVLTTSAVLSRRAELFSALSDLDLDVVEAREAVFSHDVDDLDVEVAPESLAYVIYTSGSTGRPKGVMIENRNLVNLVYDSDRNMEVMSYTRHGSVSLAMAALTFDVSVEEEFIPLSNGMTVVMATADDIMDPEAMAQLIRDNHVDVLTCTPSYLSNMIEIDTFAAVVGELSSVVVGAEAFPADLFDRLRALNEHLHVTNSYGPTECTCASTALEVVDSSDVTIGGPLANYYVATVDEQGRLLPAGEPGELVIMGAGVGRGYIGRDDLNARNFVELCGMPAYRSGDLARVRANGEVEYRGRIDDQVKLRGLRVELGEVERVIESFESVRQAVVVVVKDAQEYLAAYYVADDDVDTDALRAHARRYLASYMVPQSLTRLEELPLTANGKVDKAALPEPSLDDVEVEPAEGEVEEKILGLAREILRTERIGATTDLVEAGLSSLGAIRLCSALRDEFGVAVKTSELASAPTVRDLARLVEAAADAVDYALREDYPLSQTQQGIYFECVNHPGSTSYNLPMLYRLDASVDLERLAAAVRTMAKAHPYLNMRVRTDDEGLLRAVRRDDLELEVHIVDCDELPGVDELVRPFDLESDEMLCRAAIYRTPEAGYLYLDAHHIVSDGASIDLMIADVQRVFAGEALERETYTGFEFALDEEAARASSRLAEAHDFYDAHFRGCGGETLPPKDGDPEAGHMAFERTWGEADGAAVRAFCAEHGLTHNAFFTAAFAYALQAFCGAEQPVFSAIYNGRSDPRLEGCVSMLVKTLPVTLSCEPDDYVVSLVERCKSYLLSAMANDVFSFAEVRRAYGVQADVLFAFQGEYERSVRLGGAEASQVMLPLSRARAALGVDLMLDGDRIVFETECDPSAFSASTVSRLVRLIDQVVSEFLVRARLRDIHLVSADDEKSLRSLHDSDVPVAYRPAYRLLQDQADAHPDRTAVIGRDATLTFGELNARANAVGRALAAHGAGTGTMVAVLADRTTWAYVMREGALKAGAAFMPIDPEYPEERVRYILEDSGARIVLTVADVLERRAELFSALSDLELDVIDAQAAVADFDGSDLNVEVAPHDLAYVIYTSGSTGRPKGVMIENHNLVNLVDDNGKNAEVAAFVHHGRVSLAIAALTFDVSVEEEFIPLANGNTVVLATNDDIMDPAAIAELIRSNDVTMICCTPSYLSNLIELKSFASVVPQLRRVLVGAEAFPPDLFTRLRALNPDVVVTNSYGPTECTCAATALEIADAADVTIGGPLANYHVATVDGLGRLLPLGAVGELAILGEGVGRGYIGRDDLNARSFFELLGMRAYRSGDLVRIREDGQVEYRGRIDDQVKLRGLRVELGEIESVINGYPGVRSSVVVVAHGQSDYLAAYFTADEPVDLEALKAHMGAYLTAYMVPQAIMQLDELPLTANGKVDKRALPEVEAAARTIVGPKTESQSALLDIVRDIVDTDQVGITTDLFEAGLSSLGCIRLCSLVSSRMDKVLKVADVSRLRTVEAIDATLSTTPAEAAFELLDEYPLSQTQQGIFFECMMHPDTTIYNIPELYRIDDSLDLERLRDALTQALLAHPYLFATIARNEHGEPVARRNAPAPVEIPIAREVPSADELVRPFDLEGGERLFRVALFDAPDGTFLFLDTHHIVSDGESIDVLLTDLGRAYAGEAVEPEEFTGFEFALAEQRERETDRLDAARAFFERELAGCEGDTMPAADGHETEQGIAFARLDEKSLASEVRAFCQGRNLSANAFYTLAFGLALRSFCFAEEATFATIYNGRSDSRIARSVSMFVKTLPVRVTAPDNLAPAEAVFALQSYLLDAMANDIFSFAEVSNEFGVHGDVIFAFQGEVSDAADTHICGLPSSPGMLELSQAKAGIDLDVFTDGDDVSIDCSYDPSAFGQHTVEALLRTFLNVARELTRRETLAELRLTSTADEAAIRALHDTDWPVAERPAYRLVQDQAALNGDRVALVACDRTLTYSELNAEANAVGHVLAEAGAAPETMVAVLADRDSWAYVMRQAALKSGGCFLPIDPEYPEERVRYILEDSGARLVLTTAEILERRAELFSALADLELTVVEATEAAGRGSRENLDVGVAPENLAYVIYTSGSTGRPKGVMLTNANLVNFVDDDERNAEICGYTRRALVSLAVAALTFDFAIMEEFVPLANGMCVVLATADQIMDAAALGNLMVANRVDVMSCTPSYVSSMLDIPAFAEAVRGLRSIDFGAEAFPPGLYDHLREINPDLHVMNGYGPTEATISCTMQVVDGTGAITIGTPNVNVHVATVDRAGRLQPLGATGELAIMGAGVGRGYVGRDDLTERSFVELLGMPAYRSGDLARIRADGQIEYHGRIDDQVKLRGLRVELGEIESVLDTYPGVLTSVVVVAHGETDYLAAYFTADEMVDLNDLRSHLSDYLTAYMVPQAIMQLDEMPLTPNGKVDKRALPEIALEAADVVAPTSELERRVLDLVCEVIGTTSQIGVETDLFACGLSSIGCIRLCGVLSEDFGASVKVADVYEHRTVRELVGLVGDAAPAEAWELREEYPLSQTQQGIFVECLRMPGSTAYNIPMFYKLDATVDPARLADAVAQALLAHPYLFMQVRTAKSGDVVAVRREPWRVEVPVVDGLPDDLTSLVRPFDVCGEEPLFRAEVHRADGSAYLLLDTHHIVSDGESIAILLEDVSRAYAGEEVEAESYTGFEFALDEESGRASGRLGSAKAFFDRIFLGCGGDTLPPRDGDADAGPVATLELRSPHAAVVRDFCASRGLSANAFFTFAFGHALRSFTATEDAAVFATIYNGRSDARLARAVSMLVKTLPVANDAGPEADVVASIEACQAYLVDAMANDLYSFAEVSRAYDIHGDILFAYQGDSAEDGPETICGLPSEEIDLALSEAKAGMDVDVSLEGDDVVFDCSFSPTQFSEHTVRALLACASTVSRELTQREHVGELRLTSPADEAAIRALHDTAWPVEQRPAYRLVQDQAEKSPDAPAMVACDRMLTYAELNAEANAVGHVLAEAGAGPETMVAVLADRDSWAYVMRQAALKSGGCFLPIDPEYPEERVRYILEDSGARLVLTTAEILERRAELFSALADLELTVVEATEAVERGGRENLDVAVAPENLAYVIYTSGSTGRPKGVMLTNANLVNFVDDDDHNLEICGYTRRAHVSLAVAALTFDFAIMEEFVPLANGMCVVLATKEQILDPLALARLMLDNKVDVMSCTPSYLSNMLDIDAFVPAVKGLRSIDFGAEAFPPGLYDRLMAVNPDLHVMNGYGPTEATISCTMQVVDGSGDVTIGIPNVNVHVATVDREGRLQPLGATGELAIMGAGVGRGYVGRDDLTARSFIELLGMPAYRSGDLARIREDGQIEYRGRMDDQVKLRGLRIELGEIESVLNNYPSVRTSVVVVAHGKTDYLAAYFTADEQVDLAALKEHLGSYLTAYMVPQAIMQLDEMPLTANGKVDKRALPTVEETQEAREVKPAATELQQTLLDMYKSALGIDEVGVDDNFFEVGGTSLTAAKVMMAAMVADLPITYQDVFDAGTVEELERVVLSKQAADAAPASAAPEPKPEPAAVARTVSYVDMALANNTPDLVDDIRPGELGNVLLTGATGFLGSHILYELLQGDTEKIFCLVRGQGDVSASDRLLQSMFYYFEHDISGELGSRVIVVDGDICDMERLADVFELDFQTVFNCAASVKHFADFDFLKRINVDGVRNLAELCLEKGARLVHVSTVSVCGDVVGNDAEMHTLTEAALELGQDTISNGYVHTKFLAERAILELVGEKGLDAKIMRVGNLMSRQVDGEFQVNFGTNNFMSTLRSYVAMGCFPMSEMDERDEFSPIDEVARAIILLAGTDRRFTVFHPYNSHEVEMGNIVLAMQRCGFDIDVVDDDAFEERLRAALADDAINAYVSPLVNYSLDDDDMRFENPVTNTFTVKALYRLGFQWSITETHYLEQAIQMMEMLGFFDL